MARPAPKNSRQTAVDKLASQTSVIGLGDLIEILNSPKHLGWLKFYSGLMAGIGGVLGAALVLIVIGIALKYLHGAPVIGHLIQEIYDAAHTHQGLLPKYSIR